MQWTVSGVRKALGNKLIGKLRVRELVCKALLLLPETTIEFITAKVWFISSRCDSWAFTFKGEDVLDRYLIFLSDELLEENDRQITYTILHEVGHIMLNHRNSIGYLQTESEIKKQEQEADVYADRYLRQIHVEDELI